jgi:hypothetical protein
MVGASVAAPADPICCVSQARLSSLVRLNDVSQIRPLAICSGVEALNVFR